MTTPNRDITAEEPTTSQKPQSEEIKPQVTKLEEMNTTSTEWEKEAEEIRDRLIDIILQRIDKGPDDKYDEAYNSFVPNVGKIISKALTTRTNELLGIVVNCLTGYVDESKIEECLLLMKKSENERESMIERGEQKI